MGQLLIFVSKFGLHTETDTVLTFWLPTPVFVKVTFGLIASVLDSRTEMNCDSCEVRTGFIYVM
jgi:hypothetical protein